ncbi:L,D-transpeptidase family protein, partial [Bradyrhizobium sp.]|uniref:L,D-transpeptidase family protein n=1 Tax=Bradyrhizobium sp. TaxID=376 RepID=UPI0023913B46
MIGVNGPGSLAATVRRWRLAVLTAGMIGTTTNADAALYYWPDYSDGSYYYRQQQQQQPHVQRPVPRKRAPTARKNEVLEKQAGAKPQGPLVISISIDRQKVTVYDSNGVFAEAPISTGMKGHPTPMGVFSIIQKHKYHHSNIYSGAPMPYMQRITWSGVAMHAGVLPGYPASHGCIRMPMSFAVKLWNWTKIGARVIVAPGDMAPASFSHPMLAALKVPPQPAASLEPEADAPIGIKADRGAPETRSASTEPLAELRSTVGHAVMSDADADNALPRAAADESAKTPEAKTEEAKTEDIKAEETKTADATAASGEVKADVKSNEAAKSAETANAEASPSETADTAKAAAAVEKPAEKVEAAKAEQAEAEKLEPAKTETVNAETSKPESVKAESAKVEATEVAKKPDVAATATTSAQPAAADAKKDQTRLAEPTPAARPEPPKRAGQIAVFISRKDSKIYVRQNFA